MTITTIGKVANVAFPLEEAGTCTTCDQENANEMTAVEELFYI